MVISHAIEKYGVENFNFFLIEEVENKLLDEREIFWIAEKDSYYHGYNSTKGGKSHIGYRIPYEMEERDFSSYRIFSMDSKQEKVQRKKRPTRRRKR